MEDKVKFTETMEESSKWKFNEIFKQESKRDEFKKWYISQKAKEYNIDESSIIIHKLV